MFAHAIRYDFVTHASFFSRETKQPNASATGSAGGPRRAQGARGAWAL